MNKKVEIIFASLILGLGLLSIGLCLRSAAGTIADRDRTASVRGLCEREVLADKVTWPLVTQDLGNDLPGMYAKSEQVTKAILEFLHAGGIGDGEISVNPPDVEDRLTQSYDPSRVSQRYKLTCVIVVTSSDVEKVRELIKRQSELISRGIAVLAGDYNYPTTYEFTGLNEIKPAMIAEATHNAREAAAKFAQDSGSKLGRIITASQGQFSISDRDRYSPHIKNIRVVTNLTYGLED
ncbi:MAG: SIMPL domain-containing protein [Muribaculaceae bacterium]|nr:SIMPL domain-containing protein [Muribaculaceae bacterium]